MTPRLKVRRRRSSSRHGKGNATNPMGALAALLTTFVLASILAIGPLILGASRLWIDLPILAGVAVLILLQGLRLIAKPAPEIPRRVDAIDFAVMLFVLYAIVRSLFAPDGYYARIEIMEVVACASVFLTCRYGMANRKYCIAILYVLVGLGVGETIFGYYLSNHLDWQPFGAVENMQLHFAPRWIGTYDSPNHYASLLVMVIGAGLALGSFSKLPWAVRIILFYLALMMIVAVMFSGSRGGWISLLAAVCGLVTMGIRNGTMKWWIPVSAAAVLLVVTGLLFSITPAVQTRVADSQKLLVGAKPEHPTGAQPGSDALRIALDHPLFGVGPGNGVFVHPRLTDGEFDSRPAPRHGDYLTCLDDYGLVGLGLVMFFVTAVTLKFFRPLWVDNRWQDRVLVATGAAAWMALLVHSLVDFNLHVPANALLLFSLTGLALGRIKEEKVVHWSTLTLSPLGRWLGVGLALFAALFSFEVARTALSDNIYEKTLEHEDVVPVSDSIQGAEDALSYDGDNVPDLVLLGDSLQFQASLQKDGAIRKADRQKALDAYQQALQANGPDDVIQSRIDAAHDLMQKDSDAR